MALIVSLLLTFGLGLIALGLMVAFVFASKPRGHAAIFPLVRAGTHTDKDAWLSTRLRARYRYRC